MCVGIIGGRCLNFLCQQSYMRRLALSVMSQSAIQRGTSPVFTQAASMLSLYRKTPVTMDDIHRESRNSQEVRHWFLLDTTDSSTSYIDSPDDYRQPPRLIGICKTESTLKSRAAYLSSLVINSDYRSTGCGKIFLKSILASLENMKYSRVILRVQEQNEIALKYYKGEGFKIVEKHNGRYIHELERY